MPLVEYDVFLDFHKVQSTNTMKNSYVRTIEKHIKNITHYHLCPQESSYQRKKLIQEKNRNGCLKTIRE